MAKLLLALALSAVAVLGADVTGKWTGVADMERGGEKRSIPITMTLKQDGANVTGSAGPTSEEPAPISSGRMEENRLVLEIQPGDGPKVTLTLVLESDDHLTGSANGENNNGKFTAKLDLKREK